jgi:hypothetical protein
VRIFKIRYFFFSPWNPASFFGARPNWGFLSLCSIVATVFPVRFASVPFPCRTVPLAAQPDFDFFESMCFLLARMSEILIAGVLDGYAPIFPLLYFQKTIATPEIEHAAPNVPMNV